MDEINPKHLWFSFPQILAVSPASLFLGVILSWLKKGGTAESMGGVSAFWLGV